MPLAVLSHSDARRKQAPDIAIISKKRQGRLDNFYVKLPYLDALRAREAGATHVIISPHGDGWIVTPVTSDVVRQIKDGA